jgi:subtilisin family serine protease
MAIVAIVDTGILLNHDDFKGKLWVNEDEVPGNGVDDDGNGVVDDVNGFDAITFQGIGKVNDPNGHGTHVAGTVSQTSPNAEIMGVRFLGANGGGSLGGAINAWSYALIMGAKVINNSWGFQGNLPRQLQDIIDIGTEQFGAIFVGAAGNSSSNNDRVPSSPANAPGMISVGASDSNGNPAGFSNFGANNVALFAPGVNISAADAFNPNGRTRLSGTSMASPVVAGAVDVLLETNPSLTTAQAKQQLIDGAVKQRSLANSSLAEGVLSNTFTGPFHEALSDDVTPPPAQEPVGGIDDETKQALDNISDTLGSLADTLGTLGGQIDEIINPSASGVASSSSYKAASSSNYFEGPTAARNRGNMIIVVNSDSNDPVTNRSMKKMTKSLKAKEWTDDVVWPEAFGNKVAILSVNEDFTTRTMGKAAIKDARSMDMFESVTFDRNITSLAFNPAAEVLC